AAKDEKLFRCSWNGDVSTFQDYVRRVRLAFSRTKKKHRKHLAADLVSQLTGRAWTITQEISHERLVKEDGAKYLVQFLESHLARVPVPDAGAKAEELLVKLRRPFGMSMSTWCATVREQYRQLQRALKRAAPLAPVEGKETSPKRSPSVPSTSSPPSPTRSSRKTSKRTVPEPEAPDDEEDDDEELDFEYPDSPDGDDPGEESDARRQWHGRGRKARSTKSDSSDDDDMQWGVRLWDDMDSSLPEVLPPELLGWLMLRRSSLSPQQRLNILASVGNSLKADDIERGLRGAEEELRLHERDPDGRGKGKGGANRPKPRANFWVEQDGEWGLLIEDNEAQEWLEEGTVHWVGHDLSSIYASMDEPPTRAQEVAGRSDGNGFWHQDDDGGYTFWSKAADGEFYTQDQAGIYWAWSDFEEDQVWWSATPEQQKEISEAYATYEGKVRSFAESRALLRHKNLSRGFYPKKGKGKGKPSGFSKGKGAKPTSVPTFVAESPGPSNDVFATSGTPGNAGYTGCFVCGSKAHTFRTCPSRSNTASSSSSKGSGKIYMVSEVEEPYVSEVPEVKPQIEIPQILSSEVLQPELQGYGVLDTGATESVSSLAALEYIHLRRTELMGHGNHVTVIPGPQKMFRFGNGSLQFSESYVHLKQTVGPHEIDLGVFTLDSKGVPLLIGVRTLERLGAIIDVHQSMLVLKTVDPHLVIPLRRSRTGHLLLDLCSNWLDGGARILFMQDTTDADDREKVFAVQELSGYPHAPNYSSTTSPLLSPSMTSLSTTTASLPHELLHDRFHKVEVKGSQVLCVSVDDVHESERCAPSFSLNVETLFPVFEEPSLMQEVVEEPFILEETFGDATPFSSALLAEQRNSDLGMSLRILAILATSTLTSPHGGSYHSEEDFYHPSEGQAAARGDECRRDVRGNSRSSATWPRIPDGIQRPCLLGGMCSMPTPAKVKDLGNSAAYSPDLKNKNVGLDAAENSLVKRLEVIRAQKEQYRQGKPETKPKARATQGYVKEEHPRDPEILSQTPGRKSRKPEDAAELLEYQNRTSEAEKILDLGAMLSKYDLTVENEDMDLCTVLSPNDLVLDNLATAMSNDLSTNEFTPENVNIEYEVPDYLLDPLKYYEAPGEEPEVDEEQYHGTEATYELTPEEVNFIEKTLQEKRMAFEDCLATCLPPSSSRPGLLTSMSRRCDGRHSHTPVMGGDLAKRTALYTPAMCRAACRCFLEFLDQPRVFVALEVKIDREGLKTLTEKELSHLAETALKLHRLCGHPSGPALVRTLAAKGADGKLLAVAEQLKCMECLEGTMKKPSPKVSLEKEQKLWRTLQIDAFVLKKGDMVHHFLLMLDEASGFSVVHEVMAHHEEQHENITAQATLDALVQCWFQYFGTPACLRCDLEGAFRGDLLESFCRSRDIELSFVPAEHHEATGDVERAIGELKKKMLAYLRQNTSVEPRLAAYEMCAAHNRFARISGFSPVQWAFGRDLSEEPGLATLSAAGDPTSEMSQNLQRRLDAEAQYRKMQAKAKISRALNAKPDRTTQYIPGECAKMLKETLGYVASHVDDFLISGSPSSPLWQKTVETFKEAFSWSPWESSPFTHCGIGVSQEADWSFRLSHHTFVEELRPIVIEDKSDKVTAQEMNQARALLGAMQWRSIQTGPQHSSKVSWLQSALPKGGKDVLHQINKLSREMHHQRYLSVSTRQLGAESVDDIGFVCYTDAAVANRPNFASTGGHLVGMVHRSYLQGQKGFVNPISWRSHKLVRVARSSLSAEVQAMAEGEQELMFVRAEWSELLGRPLDLLRPERSTQHVPAAIITDAKSVYDCVSKGDTTSFNMKEKYTALELMSVFNHLEAQRTALLWVASDSQLADGLTKGSASEMLTRFFQGHQVCAASFDPEFVAAKKKKGKTSTPATSPEPDERAEFDEDFSWRDL
ncbi:unnamed protein product, partial [Durusdinium trenchii]